MRSAREIAAAFPCRCGAAWTDRGRHEVGSFCDYRADVEDWIAEAQQEAWYELRDAAVECVMRTRGEAYTVADAITALPFPIPEVTP